MRLNSHRATIPKKPDLPKLRATPSPTNAATMKLAEKLIQQQDAAVTTAAAIRANIPQQGRVLTFQRSVAVDKEADLHIGLEASAAKAASWGVRGLILGLTLAVLALFSLSSRWLGSPNATFASRR